jgi:hypothetical protein
MQEKYQNFPKKQRNFSSHSDDFLFFSLKGKKVKFALPQFITGNKTREDFMKILSMRCLIGFFPFPIHLLQFSFSWFNRF